MSRIQFWFEICRRSIMIDEKEIDEQEYTFQEDSWNLMKISLVVIPTLLWTFYFAKKLHYFVIIFMVGLFFCFVVISIFSVINDDMGGEWQLKQRRVELLETAPEKLLEEIQTQIQLKNGDYRQILIEHLSILSHLFSEKQKKDKNMNLICQKAVYTVLSLASISDDGDDDRIMCEAISLLAIIAQEKCVIRRTFVQNPDTYGPHIPIQIMRKSLRRTQREMSPHREDELFAAELQRKSCLYIGAIINSKDDKNKEEIAIKIAIDNQGLLSIMEAMDWFRCHTQVIHWALWALFNLTYENRVVQREFIRLGGISRVCRSLERMPKEREIVRHSIATLFDLLRQDENDQNHHDIFRIRTMAIHSGIHNSIYNAIIHHTSCPDIYVMGQQILMGTGYQGESLPAFVQTTS